MRFLALLLSLTLGLFSFQANGIAQTSTQLSTATATSAQHLSALPPTRDQFFSLFESYVEALRVQAGIPGIAGAIVDSQQVLWQQSFGQQDIARVVPTGVATPFAFDGLTQLFTAALTLRCVEQGQFRLDTLLSNYSPNGASPTDTVYNVLTHTSGAAGALSFSYNVKRLDLLQFVVAPCAGLPFRKALVSRVLEPMGMLDSVPGLDALSPSLPTVELATPSEQSYYSNALNRLATPYSVNATGQASPSQYPTTSIGGGGGLISTVLDFAKFDLALKQGILLRGDTLAAAWANPVNANGQVLPHGMGWFVQSYKGEPVVWQFGLGANASSSLVLTLPQRNITLILVANSDGLAQPSSLTAGDVTVSPFARIFLGLVVK